MGFDGVADFEFPGVTRRYREVAVVRDMGVKSRPDGCDPLAANAITGKNLGSQLHAPA